MAAEHPDHGSQQQNEPFVGREERPPVQLNPDMPVSEMRVRDLAQLLGAQAAKSIAQEVTIKKLELKDHKFEKWEHKWEHFHKWELKFEKFEHKDPLIEVIKRDPEGIPDPRQMDPRFDELIRQVSDLTREVAELKRKVGG